MILNNLDTLFYNALYAKQDEDYARIVRAQIAASAPLANAPILKRSSPAAAQPLPARTVTRFISPADIIPQANRTKEIPQEADAGQFDNSFLSSLSNRMSDFEMKFKNFDPKSVLRTIELSQRVGQLSGATLSSITFSQPSNNSFNLTDADIPDNITASNYLGLGGGTLTGPLTGTTMTLSSNLLASGNIGIATTSPGSILSIQGVGNFVSSATSTLYAGFNIPIVNISSTTATSTFGNGIQLSGGCFRLADGTCAGSGGGTTNSGTINRLAYYSGLTTLDSANFLTIDATKNFLGIGTTTPGTLFSIQGAASFSNTGTTTIYGTTTLPNLIATSTSATSSFAGPLYIASSTPTGSALFAVGTSSPLFWIDRNTGNIGIGSSSPVAQLAVAGDIWASSILFSASSTVYGDDSNLTFQDNTVGVKTLNQLVSGAQACSSNAILSGGIVTYSGSGFTYDISPVTYCVNGLLHQISTSTQVTLAASNASLDRIDVIVANSVNGTASVSGTPSTETVAPSINPSTQVALTFVLVQANTTSPSITQQIIYRENIASEWTGSQTTPIGEVDFNNTTSPQQGTKNTEVTTPLANNDFFAYATTSSTWDPTNYKAFSFYIQNKTAWTNALDALNIAFYSGGGVRLGSIVSLRDLAYGFSRSNTSVYQKIAIPLSDFGAIGTTVGSVRFTAAPRASNRLNFRIDNIVAEGTIGPTNPPTLLSGSGLNNQVSFWTGSTTLSGSNNFIWNNSTARLGIGTTTPGTLLSIQGAANFSNTASSTIYGTTTTANLIATSTLGIGTSTPGTLFSIQGVANFVQTPGTAGAAGNATSTLYTGLNVPAINATSTTATSTFTNGIQLAGGLTMTTLNCTGFTNSGKLTANAQGVVNCANDSGGSGTINSGTTNSLTFYSGGTTLDSADFLGIYTTSAPAPRLGIGTSTPFAALSITSTSSPQFMITDFVSGNPTKTTHWFASTTLGNLNWGIINNFNAGTTTYLTIASSTGNIGIGTTTPPALLTINGGNAIYMTSGGFLGIGTTTASGRLTLGVQAGNAQITGTTTSSSFVATSTLFVGAQGQLFNVMQNGNVGVGTTSPLTLFSVNGTSTLAGAVIVGGGYAGTVALPRNGMIVQGNVGIGTANPVDTLTINNGSFAVRSSTLDIGTGGTITTSGSYTVHTFTSSGIFNPGANVTSVDVLIVAGGGAGGRGTNSVEGGGGGGAGGMTYNTSTAVTNQNYTVTVGGGGAAGSANTVGGNGNNSVFGGTSTTGGGGGGAYSTQQNGNSGGSGGGAGRLGTGGTGTSGQGSNGGNGGGGVTYDVGGGGGGASAVGSNGVGDSNGGAGGAGTSNSINGTATIYAGGGGGSDGGSNTAGGAGGSGGGGKGSVGSTAAASGTANTGGGGGGANSATTAGNGGSGIVIVRYLTPGSSNSFLLVTTAGLVGISTTSPGALLSIQGSASFGSTTIIYGTTTLPNLVATSTTGTSTFAGSLYVASSTVTAFNFTGTPSSATAYLAVGTSSPLLWVDRVSGYVGIGTTSSQSSPSYGTTTLVVQGTMAAVLPSTGVLGVCHSNDAATIPSQLVDCSANPVADYAEQYPTEQGIDYGDIVSIGSSTAITNDNNRISVLAKSSKPYQQNMIGVVSNNYGDFSSIGYNIKASDNPYPVALNGRVPVKISTEGGGIRRGDKITSSSLAGIGMKATASGTAIGTALDDFDGSNATTTALINGHDVKVGKIMIFMNLGYAKIDDQITSAADIADVNRIWAIDQTTGKVSARFTNGLDLSGSELLNVSKILSANGTWSIDENGKLVVQNLEVKGATKIGTPSSPQGITLYDPDGNPYCVRVGHGGNLGSAPGECGSDSPSSFVPSPSSGGSTPTPTPFPTPSPSASPSPSEAPQGSPSTSPEPTASATPEASPSSESVPFPTPRPSP